MVPHHPRKHDPDGPKAWIPGVNLAVNLGRLIVQLVDVIFR